MKNQMKKTKKNEHDHDMMMHNPMMGYGNSYIEMSNYRTIFFSEDVSKQSSAQLSAMLLYYDHMDHEEPIHLYIHSGGGDATGLSNIYDVMQMIKAPVSTVLMGKCYSAGAVILAAGSKGKRYALKSSKIMIHGIQFPFPAPGDDLIASKNYFEFVKDNNDNIMKILAKHTGRSLSNIKYWCEREMWMTAEDAINAGIIDFIYE